MAPHPPTRLGGRSSGNRVPRLATSREAPSAVIRGKSLAPGMRSGVGKVQNRRVSAATLVTAARSASPRLLADVEELHGRDPHDRGPALDRLAAALGRDFAERLVAALSAEALERLEAALSPDFATGLAAALAKERGTA